MNDYAKAYLLYTETEVFKKDSDPTTIGAPREMRQFLENRLEHAFQFGVKAGEHIAAERVAKLVRGELP